MQDFIIDYRDVDRAVMVVISINSCDRIVFLALSALKLYNAIYNSNDV